MRAQRLLKHCLVLLSSVLGGFGLGVKALQGIVLPALGTFDDIVFPLDDVVAGGYLADALGVQPGYELLDLRRCFRLAKDMSQCSKGTYVFLVLVESPFVDAQALIMTLLMLLAGKSRLFTLEIVARFLPIFR